MADLRALPTQSKRHPALLKPANTMDGNSVEPLECSLARYPADQSVAIRLASQISSRSLALGLSAARLWLDLELSIWFVYDEKCT